jgi:alpha-beta hydrolase superfamily lysophospholipase
MILVFLLGACYRLDGFFFNPEVVDTYTLGGEVIPTNCQELVSFDGEEGTLYGAWAHQPEAPGEDCVGGEVNTDALPVVFFHGNADNIDGYWEYAELLWESGYEVLIFDYRGYGRSWGTPSFEGVITDGRLAVDYAASHTGHPSSEMTFIGLSLGGFVAVHNLAATTPGALITMDMFANTQKMLDDGTTLDLPSGWFFEENFDNLGVLRDMPTQIPYLVLHGAQDTYIQPEHARLVFGAAAATTKSLELIDGADHAESIEVAPRKLADAIDGWVGEHLAAE